MSEFDLIQRYFSRAQLGASRGVELGIGDDAAIVRLPVGTELVVAVDTIVEGRHFPVGTDPQAIGHRALAVNLSDMAAMGATPAWATLALTLPQADEAWLAGFSAGFMALADAHGVALVGGDTTRGALTISVQILGHVPIGTAVRRGGARPGDLLAVTGTLGDAGAGLALVQGPATARSPAASELIRRFEYPAARVALGLELYGVASAAMDLSDGLVGDVEKMAAASGVAAQVQVERLPMSAALRELYPPEMARDWALGAGDDYELLIAVPAAQAPRLAQIAAKRDLNLSIIGEMTAGSGVSWTLNGENYRPRVAGYDHFR